MFFCFYNLFFLMYIVHKIIQKTIIYDSFISTKNKKKKQTEKNNINKQKRFLKKSKNI